MHRRSRIHADPRRGGSRHRTGHHPRRLRPDLCHGFVPVKSGRRRAELERIAADKRTAVVFESPFRIAKLLTEVSEIIGPDTPLALVREATKIHEQILRGPAATLAEQAKKVNWKGECVLVIDARDAAERASGDSASGSDADTAED